MSLLCQYFYQSIFRINYKLQVASSILHGSTSEPRSKTFENLIFDVMNVDGADFMSLTDEDLQLNECFIQPSEQTGCDTRSILREFWQIWIQFSFS